MLSWPSIPARRRPVDRVGSIDFDRNEPIPSQTAEGVASSVAIRDALLTRGRMDPSVFRAALLRVPPGERDGWVDAILGLGDLPADGPDLPRGCVPYLPSAVDTLLRVVERAPVRSSDVFVDVGSGVGRAVALVHLLTGASAVGVEIQAGLVRAARDLMARLELSRVSFIEGDGADRMDAVDAGSVFFLYCPFSGDRLEKALAALERVARRRTIRVCAVDVPLPACPWLTLQDAEPSGGLTIYRSRG
jgi:SAM-dependent methyltransferase